MSQAAPFISSYDRLTSCIDGLTSLVNGVLSWIPDWAKDILGQALQKWEEFCAEIERFNAIVREIISYGFGDPDALRSAAATLDATLVAGLSSVTESFSTAQIKSGNSWQSESGTKYYDGYVAQIQAPGEMKPAAESAAGALEALADGIDTFRSNLIAGLISAGVSIAGLVVSLATIVGAIISAIALIVSLIFLFKNEWEDLQRIVKVGESLMQEAATALEVRWPTMVNG